MIIIRVIIFVLTAPIWIPLFTVAMIIGWCAEEDDWRRVDGVWVKDAK